MQLEGREIGRYRVLRMIGHGAMGDVYLAEDPRIQQQVAVKVLQNDTSPTSDLGTSDRMALFLDEARAIARLKHPRIVHLNYFDEATIGGISIIYLVTPFYKDGSLANWLQRHGTKQLSLEDVTHLITQAADALQYAHNYLIVHRDVKPSNFLIDTEGITNPNRPNLLLTDFGIAKFMTSSTTSASQAYSGGLTYMAPEQFNGQSIYASDQYALAIMAYELLTGHPPFQGAPQVIMRQHFDTQSDPPSALNPNIPKAIDTVILRALAKKPEDRFGSIEAFSTAFQRRSGFIDQPKVPKISPPIDQPEVSPPIDQQRGPKVSLPFNPPRGKDVSTSLVISPEEAQRGTNRALMLGGRSITVLVPPNAYTGLVLHVEGQGEPSPAGGSAGTLYVTISVIANQAPPPPMDPPYQPVPRPVMVQPPPTQQKSNRGVWFVLGIIGGVILVLALCSCVLVLALGSLHH